MLRAYRAVVALALAAAGLAGCDSTVGLDTTKSQFTNLYVAGACQVNNFDLVELSALLLNGPEASLTPNSKLRGQSATVGETIRPTDFRFSQISSAVGVEKQAFVEEPNGNGGRAGVALAPETVQFEYTGGLEAQDKPRLVVFLIDHSGSIAGLDRTGRFINGTETDKNDQRVTFFTQLVQGLPDPSSDTVSLVWFNDVPRILEEYATPTRNRDQILDGLNNQVVFGESGGTALAQALDATYDVVIAANSNLNPMVVLFTDGVEDEDALDLSAVTAKYAQNNVPVIVLDLQGRAGSELQVGRDRKLRDLACLTRGEYIYIERAEELTTSDSLLPRVRNRLVGAWKLRVRGDMGSAVAGNEAFLSTVLSATVGESEHSFPMENVSGSEDSRLWFFK